MKLTIYHHKTVEFTYRELISARRMHTRVTALSLCVCVCYQFAGSISRLYNTFSTAIGFSLGLSDFQLTDLSKMPSFLRKSAFHGYFVVYNPHKYSTMNTLHSVYYLYFSSLVEHVHSI